MTLLDGVLYSDDFTVLYHYPAQLERTHFEVPETVEVIAASAFRYQTYLETITLSDLMESIAQNLFRDAKNLTQIHIPSNIDEIMRGTFRDVETLHTVTFADDSDLTMINAHAFHNTNLSTITLPASLQEVNNHAFSHNENLEDVIVLDYFALGHYVFDDTHEDLVISIPEGTYDTFIRGLNWPWNAYQSAIEERE